MEALEDRRVLATIIVDTPVDELDGSITDGDISLRDAVLEANADDTINFDASLNGQTIELLQNLGDIDIDETVTIDASMLADGVIIDADDPTPTTKTGNGIRIFNITGGGVLLKNLTLQGGDANGDGGAIRAAGNVSLTLDGVTVWDSGVGFNRNGGGLFFETLATTQLPTGPVEPRLVIRDSLFQNNVAEDGGGVFIDLGQQNFGIHTQSLGQSVLIESTQFLGNTAQNRGGGIASWQGAGGELELVDSTVSGNVAGTLRDHGINGSYLFDSGGGVYAYLFSGDDPVGGSYPQDTDNGIAKLTISSSTIDHNISGSYGGGIAVCAKRQDADLTVRSQVEVVNSTVSGNIVLRDGTEPYDNGELGKGGGIALAIFPYDPDEGMDTHLQNTTVTDNRGLVGGGVWSMVPSRTDGRNRTWLTNTIVSDNTEIDVTIPNNLYGSFDLTASQYNLIGSGSSVVSHLTPTASLTTIAPPSPAPFDSTNTIEDDPDLGPLMNNGGLTETHRPASGSPVIDAGDPSLTAGVGDTPEFDQRGEAFTRIHDLSSVTNPGRGPVDIGAYEVGLAKVVDVIVSGSVSLHPEYSFFEHDATGSGEQLRTVPVGGADTIDVKFSETIDPTTISGTSLDIVGLRTGNVPTLANFQFDPSDDTGSWRYTGWTPGDHYLLSLTDAVFDGYGEALDGEWVNPAELDANNGSGQISKFPSGDDVAGGAFDYVITLLAGDADLNGVVNGVDFSILNDNFEDGVGMLFADADFNGDGVVNGLDFSRLSTNFNLELLVVTISADFMNGNNEVEQAERDFIANNPKSSNATYADGDLDGDGDVDADDLAIADAQLGIDLDLAM